MNKNAVLICLGFTIITILLLVLNNQQYVVDESVEIANSEEVVEPELFIVKQNLWHHFSHPFTVLIILGAFSFPFVLIVESTFFSGVRKGLWRLVFLLQGALFLYLTFLTWFIMVFKLFVEIDVFFIFYLILIYLGFGAVWNLLLALPDMPNIDFIQKSFDILSLKRKNTNE